MPEYTAEEVKTIMAGLLTGKPARPHRMMSDAEFLERYDPQAAHEHRIETILLGLTEAIQRLTELILEQQGGGVRYAERAEARKPFRGVSTDVAGRRHPGKS